MQMQENNDETKGNKKTKQRFLRIPVMTDD
jgi:hypothetical protein